jgi:hypothetical protein
MSKPFRLEFINGREQVIAIERQPEPVRITSREIGELLANSYGEDQAEILHQWAEAVDRWPLDAAMEGKTCYGVWPMQCRHIAEAMPDEVCRRVSSLLSTLVEYLDGMPIERSMSVQTQKVCDIVKELLT